MIDAALNQSIQNIGFVLGFALGAWLTLKIANLMDYISAIFGENMTKKLNKDDLIEKREYFFSRAGISWGIVLGLVGLGIAIISYVVACSNNHSPYCLAVNDSWAVFSLFPFGIALIFLIPAYFASCKASDYHHQLSQMNGSKIDMRWKMRELLGLE